DRTGQPVAEEPRGVGAAPHLPEQRLPLLAGQPSPLPVGAGVLATVVEVLGVLGRERGDLRLDEGVEVGEDLGEVRGQAEVHGRLAGQGSNRDEPLSSSPRCPSGVSGILSRARARRELPMGMRDRVALVFVIAAVVVTVGLGSVVAYQFAHPPTQRTGVALAAPGAASPASGGADPGDAALPPTGTTGPGSGTGAATAPATVHGAAAAAGAPTGPRADAAAAAAAAALPGWDITVGGIYEETGPVDASVGRDTVRAYFDQVNAAGGV